MAPGQTNSVTLACPLNLLFVPADSGVVYWPDAGHLIYVNPGDVTGCRQQGCTDPSMVSPATPDANSIGSSAGVPTVAPDWADPTLINTATTAADTVPPSSAVPMS